MKDKKDGFAVGKGGNSVSSSNNSQLPDRYYGDNYNMEEEMSSLTEDELRELGKISKNADRGRDRLSLPERGSRSILSAVIAFILSALSIPFSFIPPFGYILGALSLGLVAIFRLRFGFFIKLTLFALIFSLVGVTVSSFYLVFRALV